MAQEITFVNQYGGCKPKHKRLSKACQPCRARKKRCSHFAGGEDHDTSRNGEGGISGLVKGIQHSHSSTQRPVTTNTRGNPDGLNHQPTFLQSLQPTIYSGDSGLDGDADIFVERDRRFHGFPLRTIATDGAADAAVDEECPSASVLSPLIDIYFAKVHPVLPLLDETEFRGQHASGTIPIALTYAICLVAAKHSEAAPYLQLNGSSTPLIAREFCRRLHGSVIQAAGSAVRYEKITLIRILALASLHSEATKGEEEASLCLNLAMHHLQSMGWHLGQHTGVSAVDILTTKRIFWCLWSLDRLNTCIYGRPIMMSDIDIAAQPFEPGESGFPAFEVWLAITRTLNKTISFYRPGVPSNITGWEADYPSFEDAIEEARAHDLDQATQSTLHLYYLLVAVLSHRSRGAKQVSRAAFSYVRQRLCAIQITRLMESSLLSALLPLPILPCAISLAMAVSYQHLRQSQLQYQQEEARQDFKTCWRILENLQQTWSSADVATTLATKVLHQLERAPDLEIFRMTRDSEEARNTPRICTAGFWKLHTVVDHSMLDSAVQEPESIANGAADVQQEPQDPDWTVLLEGMDDIFGTYLDPNYTADPHDFMFENNLGPLN